MTTHTQSKLRVALLSTLFAAFLIVISVHTAHAQLSGSISGDTLCGGDAQHKCTAANLKSIGTRLLTLFAYLGSALLIVFMMVRLLISVAAYFRGDAMALKKAKEALFNALIGFILVFAVGGGTILILLTAFGVQPWALKLLQFFSESIVPHAYAADEKLLPNPLGSNSAYDIVIAAANLAMRFFVYPGLIAAWVASGFKFVYSQGNPEGLKTARSWLLVSFIVTVIAFSLQGFILALKATAEKVTGTSTSQTTSTDANRSANAPALGTPGAECTTTTGLYGQISTDGKTCVSGGAR